MWLPISVKGDKEGLRSVNDGGEARRNSQRTNDILTLRPNAWLRKRRQRDLDENGGLLLENPEHRSRVYSCGTVTVRRNEHLLSAKFCPTPAIAFQRKQSTLRSILPSRTHPSTWLTKFSSPKPRLKANRKQVTVLDRFVAGHHCAPRFAYLGNDCSSALTPAGSAVRATFNIIALNV
jgi:hypothetical protein